MSASRPTLCAGLVVGLLLAAPSAEARFGKKSADSSDSKDDDKGSRVHEASAIQPSRVHEASSYTPPEDEDEDDDCCATSSGPSYSERLYPDAPTYASSEGESAELAAVAVRSLPPRPPSPPIDVRMGLNIGAMGGGTAGDVFLGMEGSAMGVAFQGTKLTLPTDDGTPGTDVIHLVSLNLTAAVLSTDRLRLRVEGGFGFASAPDVFLGGPSLATSLEACLAGPLDLEVRVQGTPFPYRQLDASAGLSVHLGAFVVRAGLRGLILDDAGLVDGVTHVDRFVGPYGGAGFSF